MATCNVGRRGLMSATALLLVLVPGCTRVDNALAKVPIFAFMHSSPGFSPYEHPLPAPPGSVPFESPAGVVLPPLEATEQALNEFAASPWGQNPVAADDTMALRIGQVMYERHCQVCHGETGLGDGPIIAPNKFAFPPPSLVAAPAVARADGYIYGVIRAGRGLMPAYGARTSHDERWAIVSYINFLQAAAGAPPVPVTPPQAAPSAEGAPADTAQVQQPGE